jgi:hypothetical protein
MKLTQEFKEAFFAQYWNQEVCCDDGFGLHNETMAEVSASTSLESSYLQLKPIESITDEQASGLGYIDTEDLMHVYLYNGDDWDLLRQLGFALPFRGVPIETMIEAGILKLEK